MAEIKKFLDTTALGTLVDQIKAEDAKVLKGAKDYADGLASNYDASGAAAGALASAKEYTDALANGAVKTNTDNIAKLNGDATTEGSVAKAVADAKALIDADVDAVEAVANKNKENIAAINDGTNGILAQAKGYTDGQIEAVQGDVDDLAELVGVIPDTAEATNIVAYVQEKTAGIATSDNLEELAGRVAQAETDIDNLQADHLVAADKTELEGKIATAQSAAEGAQSTADTAKAAIDAFLKEADATETAIDTLKEIQAALDSGETTAADLLAEINALKAIDNATQAELDAALVTVNGEIDKKADKTTVEGIEGRVADLEAVDVATKGYVDQAETDAVNSAKSYADGIDTALKARLDSLEAIDHEHANKGVIDGITSEKVAGWDEAVAKAHEHANADVVNAITADNVTTWNTVTSKASQTDLEAAVARIAKNETDIAAKASDADLDDAIERIAKNETDIAANAEAIQTNTSAINSFTAITSDEVNALFA